MNSTTKSKPVHIAQQHRDTMEKATESSREAFETIGAATNEAANVMKTSCSTALQGMQDYNSKVVEFTQANAKSYVEFVQRLAGVKSPSEFIEGSNEHVHHQLTTMTEQAKQLTALAQQMFLSTTEPLKTSFAKATLAPR